MSTKPAPQPITAVLGEGTEAIISYGPRDWQTFPAAQVLIEPDRIVVWGDAGSKLFSEKYLEREELAGGWWKFTGPEKTFHIKIRGGRSAG